MVRPYYHVRYRWWNSVDLDEVAGALEKTFRIEEINMPKSDRELVVSQDDREELRVRADTLTVRLSPFRAVLFQRESAPFTQRDMELRKKIIEIYPRGRMNVLPFQVYKEPKIRTEQ